MAIRYLRPELAAKFIERMKLPYRLAKIITLKEQIEAETRTAELNGTQSGSVDQAVINNTVNMRRQLDALYTQWADGEIE